MTASEVNSTIQILSDHGVTADELKFFRRYRKGFARGLAQAIKHGYQLCVDACGSDEAKAVTAVHQIEDVEILKLAYDSSPWPPVWVAVMEKLVDQDEIYHLIRLWSREGREEAAIVGARKLSWRYLHQLQSDDGYQCSEALVWRRMLVFSLKKEGVDIEAINGNR
jgi:hypothetical protein